MNTLWKSFFSPLQNQIYFFIWNPKSYRWVSYQYKTSSPHSTSNRKWEKATGAESLSRARRYQALSSFISSLFSLSFQPHSLCSYLEFRKIQNIRSIKSSGVIFIYRVKLREQTSYSVCMLALVSSKAHSTDSGLSEVTLLHSICRFSLDRGARKRGWNIKNTNTCLCLQCQQLRKIKSKLKAKKINNRNK